MVTLVLNKPQHIPDLIMLCENLSSGGRTFPSWVICYFFFNLTFVAAETMSIKQCYLVKTLMNFGRNSCFSFNHIQKKIVHYSFLPMSCCILYSSFPRTLHPLAWIQRPNSEEFEKTFVNLTSFFSFKTLGDVMVL